MLLLAGVVVAAAAAAAAAIVVVVVVVVVIGGGGGPISCSPEPSEIVLLKSGQKVEWNITRLKPPWPPDVG